MRSFRSAKCSGRGQRVSAVGTFIIRRWTAPSRVLLRPCPLLCSKEKELHILVNNAYVVPIADDCNKLMIPLPSGICQLPEEMLTGQKYDLQFGVHVLGHYYLTTLLLPTLEATAKSTGIPTRVIDITSSFHHTTWQPLIRYETLAGGPARDASVSRRGQLYAQSKSVRRVKRPPWRPT